MLKNYFKIALRNLGKSLEYSCINIAGLAVGIAVTLLIFVYIKHELSYDSHHANADHIYRLVEVYREDGEIVEESASNPFPVGPVLANTFPDVKVTRFYKPFQKEPLVGVGENKFYETGFFFVDPSVSELFTLNYMYGNPETALNTPMSVVLTQKTARKYFGSVNPVGQTIRFENKLDFTVTGVIEDPPANSHLPYDFLASMQNLRVVFEATGNTFTWQSWYWNPVHTYVMLPGDMSQNQFERQLEQFAATRTPEWNREHISFYLQPLRDIYISSNIYQEIGPTGSLRSVYLFSTIAVIILAIACINFINLTTARSQPRAREIGLRKAMGAERPQLVAQLIGESLLMSILATLAALLLAKIFIPIFNELSGKQLIIGFSDSSVLYFLLAVGVGVGLFAGLYPAILLAGFNPANILKGTVPGKRGALRRVLVVFQFGISIVLIAGTIFIYRQLHFLHQKDLGFNEEHIVMVPIRGTSIKEKLNTFKQELLKQQGVLKASAVSDIVGKDVPIRPFGVEGRLEAVNISGLFVDYDFIETFSIKMKEGRGFDSRLASDSSAFLVNEAAMSQLGLGAVESERISWGGNKPGEVIGVTPDFNFGSLRQDVKPLTIAISSNFYSYIAIRLFPEDIRGTLNNIQDLWNRFEPDRPLEAFFLDDVLNQQYKSEATTASLFTYFAVLAVIIASLGLFGLASFTSEQRHKEIVIRKVFGASTAGLMVLLSKEFTKLVFVAILAAVPVTYIGTKRWLQDYAYRIDIEFWVFFAAGALALAIALLTVGYQTAKASVVNPVDSLRSE